MLSVKILRRENFMTLHILIYQKKGILVCLNALTLYIVDFCCLKNVCTLRLIGLQKKEKSQLESYSEESDVVTKMVNT